ncbi:replication initiation protein [Erysipelothrix rhusiopathiae]|nr:replication initiation protein [Erysipelothrix rhusiopathiae]
MNDYDLGNKVVQSNQLILGRWGLSNTLLKLFEMAVSCIDTSKPNPSRKITMNKQDIFELFEYNSTDKYVVFQRHMQQLQGQKIVLQEGEKKRSVVLVPTIEWGENENDNQVTFYFNEHIMPHLIELQAHFTQYELLELKGMKGQYSIPIFKYLTMEHNRKIHLSEHAEKGYVTINVSLDDFRYITATEKKYKDFRDFRKRVLDSSIDEINAIRENGTKRTNIIVKYETLHGKYNKVIGIKFFIRKRVSATDNDFDLVKINPYNAIDNEPRSSKENNVSADNFHRGYYEQKKKMTQEELAQFEHDLSEGKV